MLPGKLCVGILEEDNPQKSYFRLKPLLMMTEDGYEGIECAEAYPQDGCLRIVPDKNESSHFKARMRRMGRYCVLDLRKHEGENDKIRPNKNFHVDEGENNAYIVYSDVVREPAEDLIFEILDEAPGGDGEIEKAPGTARLLIGEGWETWKYDAPEAADAPVRIAPDGQTLSKSQFMRCSLQNFDGSPLRFALRLPDGVSAPIAPSPAKPGAPEKKPEPEPQPAPVAEKPWISHDVPQLPPEPHRSALDAQRGLNPRRNRSLQEIIEEKWRHSRVDQLGHPVPVDAMGRPVENPIERATQALREAWENPEIRDQLFESIAAMDEVAADMSRRQHQLCDEAFKRELEDLEAERLKSLSELDHLRRSSQALRETLKREIREEEAEALREAVEKTRAAQAELEKYREEIVQARDAADLARDAFAALDDGRFEKKLREFALTSRAIRLLRRPEALSRAERISNDAPDCEAWIARLRDACAAQGLQIDARQAANLLVCAALGEPLMLSGAASSDKRAVARALARALGTEANGRYFEIEAASPPDRRGGYNRLDMDSELPALALVRDANAAPGTDLTRGMCGAGRNLLVVSTVSDSGFPLSAEALERGFLIRLTPENADTPWHAAGRRGGDFTPVRMQTLRDAFLGDAPELPAALEQKLRMLRADLAAHGAYLSRHTLDDMYRYCAAMVGCGALEAAEALDWAFAQKALPAVLAEAPTECLARLKTLLSGMPQSLALLNTPLPIQL